MNCQKNKQKTGGRSPVSPRSLKHTLYPILRPTKYTYISEVFGNDARHSRILYIRLNKLKLNKYIALVLES